MSLREVAAMTADERAERREHHEACYRRVEAAIASGVDRRAAFTRAAAQMGIPREEAVYGYWQYLRHQSTDGSPRMPRAGR